MDIDQLVAFGVLAGSLGLFAWGRFRHDIVAILALLAVALTGLVTPSQALEGFGHPAVITVAAVLMISRALKNSGVVDALTRQLGPLTRSPASHISTLSGTVGLASAFMNNVGALAIMLPVAVSSAAERQRSASILLMPLAFASILGGMVTLIGTPPNIIIASYREDVSGTGFGFFDFATVGAPVALLGIAFVALIGWRLIPRERQGQKADDDLFQIEEYVTEVRVKPGSALAEKTLQEAEAMMGNDVVVTGLIRGRGKLQSPRPDIELREKDLLVVRADPADLKPVMDRTGLELVTVKSGKLDLLKPESLELIEAVVTPSSPLEGRQALYLRRRTGFAMRLIALARSGRAIKRRIRETPFRAGDVLLLQGEKGSSDLISDLGLLPLPQRSLNLAITPRMTLALAIFAVAITASALGFVSIALAFIAAVAIYALLDILPVRDIYRGVDWPIIVLLGGMIPVGQALESSGATALIADQMLALSLGAPPFVLLTAILVVTMFVSDLINNAATAVVMAPISVEIAERLGASADPFLMAVAVGASCAFLTPIGHQSNTLVMGPGGYEFSDYWKMGLPLEILIVAVSVPLILWAWPLMPLIN